MFKNFKVVGLYVNAEYALLENQAVFPNFVMIHTCYVSTVSGWKAPNRAKLHFMGFEYPRDRNGIVEHKINRKLIFVFVFKHVK